MKKFLAGFFTLALVLSLATGAFAEVNTNGCEALECYTPGN